MPQGGEILERVATLEANVIALRDKLESHERLHSEFMLRTDIRTELLVKQSNEWAGARKLLLGILGFFGASGVAWFLSHFWPAK